METKVPDSCVNSINTGQRSHILLGRIKSSERSSQGSHNLLLFPSCLLLNKDDLIIIIIFHNIYLFVTRIGIDTEQGIDTVICRL